MHETLTKENQTQFQISSYIYTYITPCDVIYITCSDMILWVFVACYWIYCGEGTCTKNLTYTHTCQCKTGYYNLLNVSAFPCYSDCKSQYTYAWSIFPKLKKSFFCLKYLLEMLITGLKKYYKIMTKV